MSQIKVTIEQDGQTSAYVFADLTQMGADGTDTYAWSWGIDLGIVLGRVEIDKGEIQHRTDVDGTLALLAKILERIRGRKGDK